MTSEVAKMEPQTEVPARVEGGAVTPMELLQRAVDKGADVEQLARLMDLHERWEASQARKAFVTALNAFKEHPPTITKNKRASFPHQDGKGKTEYDYVTLDVVAAVIGQALSEHGLSHRWEVEHLDGGMIRVTCILTHEQGHSERVSMQAGADQSGKKNNIQAVGSTVTYLERYTLLAVTGLAAKGQDDDATNVDRISDEQRNEIEALADEIGADKPKFCQYLGVSKIGDIPAYKYHEAMHALESKRKKAQEATE